MKRSLSRIIVSLITVVILFSIPLQILAEENATEDTLPPGYSETEEFFSWLRSETDLKALLETDRNIDGAYAEGYARRLQELYDQDSRLFISTLAECSADAQYRAVLLLPYGYIELQEMQLFYDELLLFMEEDTWSEQEMEVIRQLKSGAEPILDMRLPDPTTEPVSTEPSTEPTVSEETEPDTADVTTAPDEKPGKPDNTAFWCVGAVAIVVVAIVCVYAGMKARKR